MREFLEIPRFESRIGHWMESFIQEKRDGGYRYNHAVGLLRAWDRLLADMPDEYLSREYTERFIARHNGERPRTQLERNSIARQFCLYLNRQGMNVWVPTNRQVIVHSDDFVPHIFTRQQISDMFEAADRLPVARCRPFMPLIIRLLYGCGLRESEARYLRREDVDIEQGVLCIRDTKFGKHRMVPMAPALAERVEAFVYELPGTNPKSPLFPAVFGGNSDFYSWTAVYMSYRQILSDCGIPHGGRGKGPRLHDLRHTFAVHRLESWYRAGENVNALLPLLVAYMGHSHLSGTQYYLRLTPAIFPDLVQRMDAYAGQVIPKGGGR